MPTQTKFRAYISGAYYDLSGVFEPLNGGTAASATNYKVGSSDLNTIFHASTSVDDRAGENTGYKLSGGADLKTIFRRYGYAGITITSQPSSQTKAEGESVTFSISATTTSGTLSYQWKKNGSNVGTNSTSYTINPVAVGDDGASIVCEVSNGTSTVTSSTATLTVHYVTITDNPDAASYNEDDDPTISVSATVKPTPASYQWQYSSNNVSFSDKAGATNSSLTFTDIQPSDEYYYRCRVRNNGNTVEKNSASALIQVYFQNSITSQPTNQTVVSNGTNDAVFTIAANGKSTPTYQWQENSGGWNNLSNGGRISGATSSQLTISNVEIADNGRQFRCIVSNKKADGSTDWNNTTSNSVTLTVHWLEITSQPSGGTVNEYDVVAIGVTVNANPSPTYRWQYSSDDSNWADVYDGEFLSGAGTASATITFNATFNDIGYYRCRVQNAAGTLNSDSAYLDVQ